MKDENPKGSCLCRAVQFKLTCPIQDVIVCHCSICRKSTGQAGMAVVVVGVQSFQWISGEDHIRSWEKPGHDWQKNFCVSCASPLPGPNDANTMFIPAGLIDQGHENLRVAHHIWVASKAAWDEIGDDGQQHPRAFHQ